MLNVRLQEDSVYCTVRQNNLTKTMASFRGSNTANNQVGYYDPADSFDPSNRASVGLRGPSRRSYISVFLYMLSFDVSNMRSENNLPLFELN